MGSGHLFLGNVEDYDSNTRTYTLSPLHDRINPANWVENAKLIRPYKGIQQKDIVGYRVLCCYQSGQAFIIGILDNEDRNDCLVVNLGRETKIVAYQNGTIKLRKEIGDVGFDIITYSEVTDKLEFNVLELTVNVLGCGEDGLLNVNSDRITGKMSYKIDMGTDMQKKTERVTFLHDKDKSVIYVDGHRDFEINHSHRDLINTGKSTYKIGKDRQLLRVDNPLFFSEMELTDNELKIRTNLKVSVESREVSVVCNDLTATASTAIISGSVVEINGGNVIINGGQVEIKGGLLNVDGQTIPEIGGPFNCLTNCLFTGAPHSGKKVVTNP